ncbi:hypothetical protein IWW50_002888 [Coemansia erecta]|nr:hypothetical protein GGF43_002255 [Coemansia sp. RSA 2618]KAJ2825351.1 hypothetical protein IWW50_002888 [Coemansia erecta]
MSSTHTTRAKTAAGSTSQAASSAERVNRQATGMARPGQRLGSGADQNPAAARPGQRPVPGAVQNPAQRALEKRGGVSMKHKLPQHVRAGLSSPTDKIQSPASKAVRGLRHNTHSENLPKPQVLGSLFKSMQKKAVE